MPVIRRRTLQHLIARADEQHKTNEIAAAHQLPTSTTLRALEDLAAHGLITRYSGGGTGKADHWQINGWTLPRHTAATSPEMSDHPLSKTSNTAYDDFSGEVEREHHDEPDFDELEQVLPANGNGHRLTRRDRTTRMDRRPHQRNERNVSARTATRHAHRAATNRNRNYRARIKRSGTTHGRVHARARSAHGYIRLDLLAMNSKNGITGRFLSGGNSVVTPAQWISLPDLARSSAMLRNRTGRYSDRSHRVELGET